MWNPFVIVPSSWYNRLCYYCHILDILAMNTIFQVLQTFEQGIAKLPPDEPFSPNRSHDQGTMVG